MTAKYLIERAKEKARYEIYCDDCGVIQTRQKKSNRIKYSLDCICPDCGNHGLKARNIETGKDVHEPYRYLIECSSAACGEQIPLAKKNRHVKEPGRFRCKYCRSKLISKTIDGAVIAT